MSRTRIAIISGIILMLVLAGVLTWLGLGRQQTNIGVQGVTYTDTVSGQKLTAFPDTGNQHGDSDSAPPPLNEVTITGLDDFFSTLNSDQGRSILNDLTTFIRARTGTFAGAKAAAVNGRVNTTATNPLVYEFDLQLLKPDAVYHVTITMPTGATNPEVVFGGATQ